MRFTSYVATSALAALATAQTFTDCNPMEKDCPNDPAMPASFETNFMAGKDAVKGWKQTAGSLTYGANGAEFVVAQKGDAPTIQSEGFFHFGYVEVKMRAAPGQGIISSIVLQSQDLDEVDWEWIGGQEGKVQMNYFGKGNTTTYDRMIEAPVATTQTETHTYALDWKPESLTWIIDGKPVRTLNFADANGGRTYPQTPCNVRIGNWPGGDSKDKGTVEWAGGVTDYTKAPFKMTVESVKVTNYNPGKEYQWTDRTGSKDSIKVIDAGNTAGSPVNSAIIAPSASGVSQPIASGINAPPASGSTNNSPGGAASNGTAPCACGTKTVIVTGAPPASFSTKVSALNPSTVISKVPSITSAAAPPPSFPTSGIMIETRPPPGVPAPSAPTGGAIVPTPSRNATVSAPPAQFTGAASRVQTGVLAGVLAGAVVLAL